MLGLEDAIRKEVAHGLDLSALWGVHIFSDQHLPAIRHATRIFCLGSPPSDTYSLGAWIPVGGQYTRILPQGK